MIMVNDDDTKGGDSDGDNDNDNNNNNNSCNNNNNNNLHFYSTDTYIVQGQFTKSVTVLISLISTYSYIKHKIHISAL